MYQADGRPGRFGWCWPNGPIEGHFTSNLLAKMSTRHILHYHRTLAVAFSLLLCTRPTTFGTYFIWNICTGGSDVTIVLNRGITLDRIIKSFRWLEHHSVQRHLTSVGEIICSDLSFSRCTRVWWCWLLTRCSIDWWRFSTKARSVWPALPRCQVKSKNCNHPSHGNLT